MKVLMFAGWMLWICACGGLTGCSGTTPAPFGPTPPPMRDHAAETRRRIEAQRSEGIVAFTPPTTTFEQLRETVTPFGVWVTVPIYGEVWKPSPDIVGENWVPYSRGRWVHTECGWTWISAFEKWGWAPFHFGRFAYTPTEGWVWVPDTTWAPAHVAWRDGETMVGWAAVPPGYSVTEEVTHGSSARIPREAWLFVRKRDFTAEEIAPLLVTTRDTRLLMQRTRRIRRWHRIHDNTGYVFVGPHRAALEEHVGRQVPTHAQDELVAFFGERYMPAGFEAQASESVDTVYSEILPNLDWRVTVAGPESPRKLPPRKLINLYTPGPEATSPPPAEDGRPPTARPVPPQPTPAQAAAPPPAPAPAAPR